MSGGELERVRTEVLPGVKYERVRTVGGGAVLSFPRHTSMFGWVLNVDAFIVEFGVEPDIELLEPGRGE